MLATLLGLYHALMHTEMPIHMRRLLLLAFFVILKAASALSAGNTKSLVECSNQVWSGTMNVSSWLIKG
jgi:hypothetical protein